jgi:hypothetical protein
MPTQHGLTLKVIERGKPRAPALRNYAANSGCRRRGALSVRATGEGQGEQIGLQVIDRASAIIYQAAKDNSPAR